MATVGLPLPGVSSSQLPTSNAAGNNQYSPPLAGGASPNPIFTPMQGAGSIPSTNPYLAASTTTSPTPLGQTTAGSLYNPASSQSSGQTDISKQLIDIYGKGVGGSLNYLLQGMSGTDSAIFQQYLASMKPQMAQAGAALSQGLGAQGVGGNSSVNALAQANLQSQFLAQESGVNANLMQQQLADTIGILTGAAPSAQKEVAQSGWTDFANVMANITGDIGALAGGKGPSPGTIPGNDPGNFAGIGGASNYATPQLTGLSPELGAAPAMDYTGASLGASQALPSLAAFG